MLFRSKQRLQTRRSTGCKTTVKRIAGPVCYRAGIRERSHLDGSPGLGGRGCVPHVDWRVVSVIGEEDLGEIVRPQSTSLQDSVSSRRAS